MASWAAMTTYLMHEHRPTTGRTAEVLLVREGRDRVSHLFRTPMRNWSPTSPLPFTNKNGYPVDPDAVMHVISMVVQADPLSEAIDILETNRPAWRVHKQTTKCSMSTVNSGPRSRPPPRPSMPCQVPVSPQYGPLAARRAGRSPSAHDGSLIRVEKNQRVRSPGGTTASGT